MGHGGSRIKLLEPEKRSPSDWSLVHRTSLKKWKRGVRLEFGFHHLANYSHACENQLTQPWSCEGRMLAAIERHKFVHTDYAYDDNALLLDQNARKLYIEEKARTRHEMLTPVLLPTEIPLKKLLCVSIDKLTSSTISHYQMLQYKNTGKQDYYSQFRGINIIGAKDDVLVIQFTWFKGDVKLAVIKEKTGPRDKLFSTRTGRYFETVAVYSDITTEDLIFYEAIISPDASKLLVRPSPALCMKHLRTRYNYAIQLLAIRNGKYKIC